jgi:acyl-CoA dehydrogenase
MHSLHSIDYEIAAITEEDIDKRGMGTTLTALLIRDEKIALLHVGDSRCYRLRSNAIEQLSVDHSVVQELLDQGAITPKEAIDHPQRSMLTQALRGDGTTTPVLQIYEVKKGDRYVINGQKVWISRIQHSDLMILLARTTPLADVQKKSEGMSIFIVDLHQAIGKGMEVRPIANMVNHETNEVFFDNLEIPAENLIGVEGQGFKYILDGLNAERTLIAAECIGDAYWFIDRARRYANDRVVFDRPIGKNQGIQFPIADSYIETEAANLMRFKACELFDRHEPCGAESNMAKYLAAKASWEAANVCMQTHGGFGFACEYDVERKFRETRLYQVAPISTNLIYSYVAEHLLGLPRSF